MTVTEITVAYVNSPRGNAKSATIKDTGGAYYGIDPKWQSQFTPGVTYKLEYDTDPTGKYRNVKRFKAIGGAPAPAGHAASDPGLAERIFVCGALNAMLSNPNTRPLELNIGQLTALTNVCRDAWVLTFGKGREDLPPEQTTKAAPRDDMDDSVPW